MSNYDLSKSGVYHIINTLSGKHYIGSAVEFYHRWHTHKSELNLGKHGNSHLQYAWNKYGEGAFEFSVIEYVDDPKQLTTIEQLYIDAYWPTGMLYNLYPTAGSPLGTKHTENTRRKMSEAGKGRPKSAEHRSKIGAAHKGRQYSQETTAKMREAGVKRHGNITYLMTFPDGHQEQIRNLRAFCRLNRLDRRHIKQKDGYQGYHAVKT